MDDLYADPRRAPNASADDIKSAYRKRARALHPDVNKSPDAQERFAELQRAYEILSSDEKRRRYDRTGRVDAIPDPPGGAGFGADDFGEMFDAFFRGRQAGPHAGAQPGTRARPAPPRSLDTRAPLSLDLETVDRGGTVRTRTPAGEVAEVTIPPAVAAGATLRVKGKGERSPDGRRGDLILEIRVKPHETLARGAPGKPDPASLDLTARAEISIADATLGGEARVDRLGQSIRLTVPPATPSGRSLRAKGKGLTNAAGRSGDLFVELRIVPPDPAFLSPEDAETLRRIAGAPNTTSDAPGA
jgi:curved DNA-binding protein